ncbi:MAG: acyl-CoA dehydrogenase [Deltaproteobacteria bacterium]|nr:acyl-CoA dehydrogenase [Deltaproteobacteria bacterium]MBW2384229.1 acyl-CoA dehydrogenase [Deltaproteobacteria bacterium]MBW2699100.1 acyl-CoA dehydrogenase [Deltaproteobacteria bacterium]
MALVLTEEQELLKQTAREFIQEKSPVSELRRLRDARDPTGLDRGLWKEMAELGWAGVLYPEEYGGMDLGYVELGQIFEECGRALVAQPLLSTVVLAGGCVLEGGNETQKKDVLTAVAAGERLLALAHQEGAHHDPHAIATRAESKPDGYELNGRKTFVLDGHIADQIVVVARTSGENGDRDGLTLFLVDPDTAGLEITRTLMVDGRNSSLVELDRAVVSRTSVIGEVGRGANILDRVLDRATVALSAEMLGTLSEAFDKTVDYLKTREQFGQVIGTFQALKHRAAQMFVEIELTRSIVLEALSAIDADDSDTSLLASCAKARCNDAIFMIGNEAIQMYGGIGVTDEEDIGLFLKRARVTQLTLGNSAWHLGRFATLQGY